MQKTILFILTTIFFAQVYSQNILEGKRVLWIGTSIPAHCTYPKNACENLGMTCRNHAIGASFLSIRPFSPDEEIETHTGYALSMSSAEKEELYQPWLQEGRITRHRLDVWKFSSYDQRIIQYLDPTTLCRPNTSGEGILLIGTPTTAALSSEHSTMSITVSKK